MEEKEELDLKAASEWLSERGRSVKPDALRRAALEARLAARRVGAGNRATWFTTPQNLEKFLGEGRRPGRPRRPTDKDLRGMVDGRLDFGYFVFSIPKGSEDQGLEKLVAGPFKADKNAQKRAAMERQIDGTLDYIVRACPDEFEREE